MTADGDCSHEIKTFAPWKKSYEKHRQHIKKQRHYFAKKGPSSQSFGFSSSHVWKNMTWVSKNWCFWSVVLENTPDSPLDCKVIKPVHPKGNQSWILIGKTDARAETPILWPPDVKNWLIGKTLMLGKIECGDREWDGWMASPTQWTWVWVSSRSWWWTGKPGMLQSIGLQRVRHNWVIELNRTESTNRKKLTVKKATLFIWRIHCLLPRRYLFLKECPFFSKSYLFNEYYDFTDLCVTIS